MAKKIVDKEKVGKLKEKGHGFFAEFKEFVMRGNVMDMAIGVIIGGAFAGIVTALTDDFINPLINGIGGAEVGGTFKIYGGQVIKYGDMALVLFIMLKAVNKVMELGKKEKEEEEKKSEEVALLEEIRDLLKKRK